MSHPSQSGDRPAARSFAAVAAAAGWLGYAITFAVLAPKIGAGAASFAAVPAILSGWLLGWRGGLAMGVVSLPLNEILLAAFLGRPLELTLTDAYYASISAAIGGAVGWIQAMRWRLAVANRSAEEARERYRLLATATDGVVWDWDLTTGKVWRNENAERYVPGDQDGSADAWAELTHPDDRERVRASLRSAIADPSTSILRGAYRLRRADGGYSDVVDRGCIIRDENGQAVRMLGSMQDVSEQLAAQRALRESETSFRTFFANVPVGLYRTTPQGSVALANPALARLLGYSSLEELQTRDLNDGVESEYGFRAFQDTIEEAGFIDRVSTWTTRDGRKLNVRETATLVRDEAGAPLYYEGVVEDLTDRTRLERDAREKQRALERSERLSALGTLVAGVAHEVNNPLAYIRGNVELVQMTVDDITAAGGVDENAREQLAVARRQLDIALRGIDQLAAISSSLKAVARQTAGKRTTEDIDALVRHVMLVAEARMPPTASLRSALTAQKRIDIVPDQVTQVLLNLLFNSADAVRGRPDAEIFVRTYEKDKQVVIEVSDNGTGIPPEQHEKIFVPFHTTKQDGTGLGLSVSYGIVQSHGGTLSFDSAVGKGTTFRVALPLA